MGKVQVSIVIPVYNAGKYLKEVLECLINQIMSEFECICVDDASDDGSFEILKEYSNKDQRFRILRNNKREGAAITRNRGLELAQGEYICFFDADDVFTNDLLQKLYEAITDNRADVAICNFTHFDNEHIYDHREKFVSNRYIAKFCEKSFCAEECSLKEIFDILTPQPWNKMYRREFINRHALGFQTLENSNDVYFVTMALGLADRLILVNDKRVLYRARNHKTVTRISAHRKPICAYKAAERIIEDVNNRNVSREKLNYFYLCVLRTVITGFNSTISQSEEKEYYDFLNSKGIEDLMTKGEACEPFVDRDIINKFHFFIDFGYYENLTFKGYALEVCLEKERKAIENVMDNANGHSWKIGLWGIGYNGKVFWECVKKWGYEIDYPADKKYAGKEYSGIRICDIDEMIGKSDIIFVSTDQVPQAEVLANIDAKKTQVYSITGELLV